jgi:hypothetical protein
MGYVQARRGFTDQHSNGQMNAIETIKSERFSGYRILILAIFFSLAWHLFWLSAIKVVAPSPAPGSQARFSKVSFLGQILAKVNMEVRSQAVERSLLERRYNVIAAKLDQRSAQASPSMGQKPEATSDTNRDTDGAMSYLIKEAVSGAKAEPDYGAE